MKCRNAYCKDTIDPYCDGCLGKVWTGSIFKGHPDQHYGPTTYSQHGEDLIFLNIFDQLQIKNPSWLDLGAHCPITISNTKLLYDRGYRGVNVEANENLIEEFYKQRPEDTNVHIGVSVTKGTSTFYMYDDFSGRNTLSNTEVDYVNKKYKMTVTSQPVINVTTLAEIVDTYCQGHYPELLTCDIEGLDYDVLETADFSKSSPIIICVEARDPDKMCKMMQTKMFYPYVQMGENIIFLRDIYHYTITKSWPHPPRFQV